MDSPVQSQPSGRDEAGFAAACEQARPGLFAYAVTCCRDPHLAEDIVQETLLIALRKRELYLEESNFALWLVAIARNVWFRERERAGVRRRRLVPQAVEDLAIELVEVAPSVWDSEAAALRQCLEHLGEEDRSLLSRHFTDDQGYAEVAQALHRTLVWVKVRMHRLRRSLRVCVQHRLAESGNG